LNSRLNNQDEMKKQKLLFILAIIGIFILLILTTKSKPITEGIVKEIKYEEKRIIIKLENQNQEIIVFSNQILNLKPGQNISVIGKQEIYQNKTQILADKIKCSP